MRDEMDKDAARAALAEPGETSWVDFKTKRRLLAYQQELEAQGLSSDEVKRAMDPLWSFYDLPETPKCPK